MKRKIVKVFALAIIMCFSTSVVALPIWIDNVDVIPGQPLVTDIITFEISGQAPSSPSEVEYDQFTQNGTLLQLDLYVNMGFAAMISDWTYSKDISPLPAGNYTLEVRAFDNYYDTLEETYTVDFTVVPEPTTFVLFCFGGLLTKNFINQNIT
jgi:hypothetical protein